MPRIEVSLSNIHTMEDAFQLISALDADNKQLLERIATLESQTSGLAGDAMKAQDALTQLAEERKLRYESENDYRSAQGRLRMALAALTIIEQTCRLHEGE